MTLDNMTSDNMTLDDMTHDKAIIILNHSSGRSLYKADCLSHTQDRGELSHRARPHVEDEHLQRAAHVAVEGDRLTVGRPLRARWTNR